MVNIVITELQMLFLTSTVIDRNGNMKELERKIKCEKLMFRYFCVSLRLCLKRILKNEFYLQKLAREFRYFA